MDVNDFSEIEDEFMARVRRIAWCTAATVDRKGRPRTRILHPIWEHSTGWIATGRHSLKEKHIEKTPYMSLTYWDPQHQQIYADCRVEWADGAADKQRIWDLYKNTPPPLGYDPIMIWPGGVAQGDFGLLKLTPYRVELFGLGEMFKGEAGAIWRNPSAE